MMRKYELTFLFRMLPTHDEQNEALEQVISWIEQDDNGKVHIIDRKSLGRRRLAYMIDKQREGLYVILYSELDPAHLPELELNLKLYTNVLRYLVIRNDDLDFDALAGEPEDDTEETVEEPVAENDEDDDDDNDEDEDFDDEDDDEDEDEDYDDEDDDFDDYDDDEDEED